MWCKSEVTICLILIGALSAYGDGEVTGEPFAGGDVCDFINNCKECQNPTIQCFACDSGHALNADNSHCLECPGNCDTCQVSGSSVVCTMCDTHYYKAEHTCQKCVGDCAECSQENDCSTCDIGFHLLEKTQRTCEGCSANCEMCVDIHKCTLCRGGFYLNMVDHSCSACPSSPLCASCISSSKCDICVTGKFWDGTECENCMADCDSCVDEDTCTECSDDFVLGPGGVACILTATCTEYMYYAGCTECIPGYSLDQEMRCMACPVLDSVSCASCASDTRGHYWDVTTAECKYCLAHCLVCASDEDCISCTTDRVWDDISQTCQAVICEPGTVDTLNEDECGACSMAYWDTQDTTCKACSAIPDFTADSHDGCVFCPSDTQGYSWIEGSCLDVNCDDLLSLNQDACDVCPSTYWHLGDSECTAISDEACSDVDSLTDSQMCTACPEKVFVSPVCSDSICVGDVNNEMVCRLCSGKHVWNSLMPACTLVDCTTAGELPQEACTVCGREWDDVNTLCKSAEITCGVDSLTTEFMCAVCHDFYWDGSACQAITCASDTLDSAVKCHACAGKYWDGAACQAITAAYCSGEFDEEKCKVCDARYWNSQALTCSAVTCLGDGSASEAECYACPGRYWADNTCTVAEPSSALDNENDCNANRHNLYLWENGQCRLINCGGALGSEGQCTVCGKTWESGYCKNIDCTESSILSESACQVCYGNFWDTSNPANERCQVVTCDDITNLDTEEKCNNCDTTYWDSDTCVELADCSLSGIIVHNAARCSYCGLADIPKMWDPTVNQCVSCPLDCLECDMDGCLLCVDGKFWDQLTRFCVDCATNALDTEAKCTSCPGKHWQNGVQCVDCVEGCLTCINEFQCIECEVGKIFVNELLMCLDCTSSSTIECKSCGSISRGRYLHPTEQLCFDCPVGCADCDVTNVCNLCASSYVMDENDICESCASLTIDTVEKCVRCGEPDTFWDTSGAEPQCTRCNGVVVSTAECINCPVGCEMCSAPDNCEQCEAGKYFITESTTCVVLDSRCAVSSSSEGCRECDPRYWLNGQICDLCTSGCNECSDGDKCTQCSQDHCLDIDGQCHATNDNCDMCEVTDGEVTCLSCVTSFTLQICLACNDVACMDCSGSWFECIQCMPSYYINVDTQLCQKCMSNCAYCSVPDECTICDDRHYLDPDQTCKACKADCLHCTAELCTECVASDMYSDEDGICHDCMPGCEKCSSGDQCLICDDGKSYSDLAAQCLDCIVNCMTCDDGMTCKTCDADHFRLNDGTCKKCAADDAFPYCYSCVNDGFDAPLCTSCSGSYVLKDDLTECVACPVDECNLCIDPPAYCMECAADYSLTPDLSACTLGCYNCDGDGCQVPASNTTVEPCVGLGSTHSCRVDRQEVQPGSYIYSRRCHNSTCNPQTDCVSNNEEAEICTSCCTENLCNNYLMSKAATRNTCIAVTWCIILKLIYDVIAV